VPPSPPPSSLTPLSVIPTFLSPRLSSTRSSLHRVHACKLVYELYAMSVQHPCSTLQSNPSLLAFSHQNRLKLPIRILILKSNAWPKYRFFLSLQHLVSYQSSPSPGSLSSSLRGSIERSLVITGRPAPFWVLPLTQNPLKSLLAHKWDAES